MSWVVHLDCDEAGNPHYSMESCEILDEVGLPGHIVVLTKRSKFHIDESLVFDECAEALRCYLKFKSEAIVD